MFDLKGRSSEAALILKSAKQPATIHPRLGAPERAGLARLLAVLLGRRTLIGRPVRSRLSTLRSRWLLGICGQSWTFFSCSSSKTWSNWRRSGLALALQSALCNGCQVSRAPAVCVPHGAPSPRLHRRGSGRTPEVLDGESRHPDSRRSGIPRGSSAQAQGSPKDPRARLLPSSPEPFEMVWNPGASQSATSSSQLPGGSAAGCRHGQPSEPHQLGSKPAPGTPGETQAARTQGSLTCHHRSKAVGTAILRCGSLISPSSFTDCPPPELTPAP